jgi:hypothetical protein
LPTMVLPDVVKILHLSYDHTDAIGRYAEGQFFADGGICPVRGAERFRWYYVVHLFADDGGHVDSHVWSGGTDSPVHASQDVPERRYARRKFRMLLDGLPERQYCDIAIRPFRLDVQGIVFGLIDESARNERDTFVLYPGGLTFQPPWCGTYDCHHRRQPEPG